MAFIGNTPEFNIFKGDWTLYTEILEQYFEINSIDDGKKCAYLISVIGPDCYKILSEICYPEIPKNKSYDELCYLLSKHFGNKNSIFVIRNKFYRATQYPTESITLWFNRVKKLSKECRFANNIETILVDRFISGIKQIPLDGFYDEKNPISLDKAFNMALEREKNYQPGPDVRHEMNYGNNQRKNQNYQKNNEKPEEAFEIIEKKNNLGESSGSQKKDKYLFKANDVVKKNTNPFISDDLIDIGFDNERKVNNFGKFNQSSSNINEKNQNSWKEGNTKEQFDGKVQHNVHKWQNASSAQPPMRRYGSQKNIEYVEDIPIYYGNEPLRDERYPVHQKPPNFNKNQNRYQNKQQAQPPMRRHGSQKNVEYVEEIYYDDEVVYQEQRKPRNNRRKPKKVEEEDSSCVLS